MSWLAVAVAGALGALARYAVGTAVGVRAFPWATLGINLTGAFLLGFLVAGPLSHRLSSPASIGITVGFLGAFTTFSTFGVETVLLIRGDRLGAAATYVGASVIFGLGLAAVGWWLGQLTSS